MTHKLDADDFFIHRVQQHCAERGLNFFLVEPLFVERFYECYSRNEIWARVLLNMHSEHHLPEDIFSRVVRLAHERGTKVIDDPIKAEAAFDKSRMHQRLAQAGFRVPYTLIVPAGDVTRFKLSSEEKLRLGEPFVVKPSHGYGRKGVLLDAHDEGDLVASVNLWRNPAYLLQERIRPKMEGELPFYFRVFFVFGQVWACWWNCFTDRYKVVTSEEREQFGLAPLEEIVRGVARVSEMSFFSSEIALTDAGEFILIDYVNDQCHMLSQSANAKMGVPDAVVAAIAQALVENAQALAKPLRA
jgi:hypothetical protein